MGSEMHHDFKSYRAYTDSGIPWVGAMPAHWGLRRLDRLFSLRSEIHQEGDDRVTGYLDGRVTLRSNVAGQKIKGVIKETGWQRVYPGDFAISGMNAHLGGMGVSDSLGKCSPIYLVLRPGDGTNAHFVAHSVRHTAHSGGLKALVNTIRFNSADFKRDDLKLIRVWIPPADEQAAIVRFIEHADRRVRRFINAKRKLIELLNEQKQAIIHRAVTRGLDPNVRLKPSGIEWLGKLPEHWDVRRLRHAAHLLVSNVDKHAIDGELPVRLCNYVDVYRNDVISVDTPFMHATATREEITRFRLRIDDVLITKDSEDWKDIGIPAYVATDALDLICGYHLAILRPYSGLLSGQYLKWLLQSSALRTRFSISANGVTRYGLSQGAIKEVPILLPPIPDQAAIARHLDEATETLENAIARAHGEVDLLREYHTRLMADVVTGKLDVRETVAGLPAEPGEDNQNPSEELEADRNREAMLEEDELTTVAAEAGAED